MIQSPLLSQFGGYVGGAWVQTVPEQTFPVINPATGEELARVPDMGESDTTAAVEAAEAARRNEQPLAQRREWLLTLADLLMQHKAELGRIITLEQGKPLKEAMGEVDYAAGFFRHFARIIDCIQPRRLEEPIRGCRWTVYYRPAGVVGLITPWNFPLAMLAKKLSAALAAGCGVVAKPAAKTPLTMVALWHLIEQLDLPKGQANLIIAARADAVSRVMFNHPAVRLISFTGSTEVGKKLIEQSARQVKRVALELGGNAPFLVFEDADLDAAADALVANKFRAGGQTCVCANRIYAHRAVARAFADAVARRVATLKVGDGMEEGTDIGPLIGREGFEKVAQQVSDALAKGAQCLVGGASPSPHGEWGCFYPPTVLTGITQQMLVTQEETFGPVIPIGTFDSEAEATRLANSTTYGLAAYIFTTDPQVAQRVIGQLQFGHVGLNTGTGPTPEAPFGGMKQSGFGREGGMEGLLEYCEPQAVAEGK